MGNAFSREIQKSVDTAKKAFIELGKVVHRVVEDLKRETRIQKGIENINRMLNEKKIFIPMNRAHGKVSIAKTWERIKESASKKKEEMYEVTIPGWRTWLNEDGVCVRTERIKTKEGEGMMEKKEAWWIRSYSVEMAEAIQKILFKKGYNWGIGNSEGRTAVQYQECASFTIVKENGYIKWGGPNCNDSDYHIEEVGIRFLIETLPKFNAYTEEEGKAAAIGLGLVTRDEMLGLLKAGRDPIEASIQKWIGIKKIGEHAVDMPYAFKYLQKNVQPLVGGSSCALCHVYSSVVVGCRSDNRCPLVSSRICKDSRAYGKADSAVKEARLQSLAEACDEMLEALEEAKGEKGKLTKATDVSNVASYVSRSLNYGIAISNSEPNCLIMALGAVVPRVERTSNYYKIYFEEKKGGKS